MPGGSPLGPQGRPAWLPGFLCRPPEHPAPGASSSSLRRSISSPARIAVRCSHVPQRGGMTVSATARVAAVRWAMGDGAMVTCTGPGTPTGRVPTRPRPRTAGTAAPAPPQTGPAPAAPCPPPPPGPSPGASRVPRRTPAGGRKPAPARDLSSSARPSRSSTGLARSRPSARCRPGHGGGCWRGLCAGGENGF
jgi:hypothetical protein